MTKIQKIIYFIIAILLAASFFVLGINFGESNETSIANENQSAVLNQVVLLIDNGEQIKSYKLNNLTSARNVLESLKQVTQSNKLTFDYDGPEKSAYGAFVKQIGEQKNGDGQKYWQYWVNGAQPLIAADKYELKGGEVILWTFRKSAM